MEPCWMITEDLEGRLYLVREVRNEEKLLVFLTMCNLNQNLSSASTQEPWTLQHLTEPPLPLIFCVKVQKTQPIVFSH